MKKFILKSFLFICSWVILFYLTIFNSCKSDHHITRDTTPTHIQGLEFEFITHNINSGRILSIGFPDEKNGFITDQSSLTNQSGSMYKTDDSGKTWIKLNSSVQDCVFAFYFFNSKEGIAVGNSILQTTDGGSTWNLINHYFSPKVLMAAIL